MKKLVALVLLAAFAAACTPSVTDEAYETKIQLIDKKKIETPTTKSDKKDG